MSNYPTVSDRKTLLLFKCKTPRGTKHGVFRSLQQTLYFFFSTQMELHDVFALFAYNSILIIDHDHSVVVYTIHTHIYLVIYIYINIYIIGQVGDTLSRRSITFMCIKMQTRIHRCTYHTYISRFQSAIARQSNRVNCDIVVQKFCFEFHLTFNWFSQNTFQTFSVFRIVRTSLNYADNCFLLKYNQINTITRCVNFLI